MRTILEVLFVAWGLVQVVVWLGALWQLFFGRDDPRFAGAKLWYRS